MSGSAWGGSRPVPLDVVFPRPVLIPIGGRYCKAGPLSLGELATLQAWLRQAAEHPLRNLPPPSLDPDPGTRRQRLLEAWRAQKTWPPLVGSAEDAPYLATLEGRAVFLIAVLGGWTDRLSAEDAEELAEAMTPEDWAVLRRVAWGLPPWRELAIELDPAWREAQESGRADGPPDWARLIVSVMRHGHYDYTTIEGWTPAQLMLYCREGELDSYRAVRRQGESREQFVARMIETFPPESIGVSGAKGG